VNTLKCGCDVDKVDMKNELAGYIWTPCDEHEKILTGVLNYKTVKISAGRPMDVPELYRA
jgi:hypothetical protein